MGWFSRFSSGSVTKIENDQVIEQNSKTAHHVYEARNWYYDRYETLIVQRNILFLIAVLSIMASIVCVFFIGRVTLSKSIEPMIIEVEDTTGITNIVNPFIDTQWSSNKALSEYFLIMYLRTRETYNVVDYGYNYSTVVRLLSNTTVYKQFRDYVNDPSTNPVALYGANNSTILTLRSVQYLEDAPSGDHNVQVRFAITEASGSKKRYNKIASILWNYTKMNMTFDERMVNPLGFQIKFYAVTNDIS